MNILILILALFPLHSFAKCDVAFVDLEKIITETQEYQKHNVDINAYIQGVNHKIEVLKEKSAQLFLKAKEFNGAPNEHMLAADSLYKKAQDYIDNADILVRKKIIRQIIPILEQYQELNSCNAIVEHNSVFYTQNGELNDITHEILSTYLKKEKN